MEDKTFSIKFNLFNIEWICYGIIALCLLKLTVWTGMPLWMLALPILIHLGIWVLIGFFILTMTVISLVSLEIWSSKWKRTKHQEGDTTVYTIEREKQD